MGTPLGGSWQNIAPRILQKILREKERDNHSRGFELEFRSRRNPASGRTEGGALSRDRQADGNHRSARSQRVACRLEGRWDRAGDRLLYAAQESRRNF